MSTIREALDVVESRRKAARLSIRDAADRAGISESNWRQLVAGEVRQADRVIARTARLDQALIMAAAVGALEEVAELLDAEEAHVHEAREAVVIVDPAEAEILGSRHLSTSEKLILLESLQRARDDAAQ